MSEEQREVLSYLAGYVDGEACISLLQLKVLKFGIVSADREVLELMARTFGGSVQPEYRKYRGQKRRFYRWRVNNTKAQEALRRLLPFLKAKHEEAERACELKFSCGYITLEMLEARRKLKRFLKQTRAARFTEAASRTPPDTADNAPAEQEGESAQRQLDF